MVQLSAASSACLRADVERASLAKDAALKQKPNLECQEADVKAKRRKVLDLQTAIGASGAEL